ncbi:MAG TPA: hypothetical protein PK796_11955 [Bacteroidales bacterium]|nr:hypothetical protein [Bacteroidales bacterium]
MYQDTLSTREVLHDLTTIGSSLTTLSNKGKDYDQIIQYIIENKFYYYSTPHFLDQRMTFLK